MRKLSVALLLAASFVAQPAWSRAVLTPLDPAAVDQTYASFESARSYISFVNETATSVVIYWIDFQGSRVFQTTLAANASFVQETSQNHPFLVVQADTGGTLIEGTGRLLAGFVAERSGAARDDLNIAYIRSAVSAVPEPASWALMIAGFGGIGVSIRQRRTVRVQA